jgi:hypothetical protein
MSRWGSLPKSGLPQSLGGRLADIALERVVVIVMIGT